MKKASESLIKIAKKIDSVFSKWSKSEDSSDKLIEEILCSAISTNFAYPKTKLIKTEARDYLKLTGPIWRNRTFYYLSKVIEALEEIRDYDKDLNIEEKGKIANYDADFLERLKQYRALYENERKSSVPFVRYQIREGNLSDIGWRFPDFMISNANLLMKIYEKHIDYDEKNKLIKIIYTEIKKYMDGQVEPDLITNYWWGAATLASEVCDKEDKISRDILPNIKDILPKIVTKLLRVEIPENKELRMLKNKYELPEFLTKEWATAYLLSNAATIYNSLYRSFILDDKLSFILENLRTKIDKNLTEVDKLIDKRFLNDANVYALSHWIIVSSKVIRFIKIKEYEDQNKSAIFLKSFPKNIINLSKYEIFKSYMSCDNVFNSKLEGHKDDILKYVNGSREIQKRPLNFLVCGPPGAGKSFFVKQLLASCGVEDIETANISQLDDPKELLNILLGMKKKNDKDDQIAGLFIDEIDVKPDRIRQYARLLMPMWDREIFSEGKKVDLRPLIIGFGVSGFRNHEEFKKHISMVGIEKAADFLSRLDFCVDLPRLNDPEMKILIAASLIYRIFKCKKIEKKLLAWIGTSYFENNVRQLEKILVMSKEPIDGVFRCKNISEEAGKKLAKIESDFYKKGGVIKIKYY